MYNVLLKIVLKVLSVRPAHRDGAGGEGAGLRQHQLSAHEQAGVAVGLYTNRFTLRTCGSLCGMIFFYLRAALDI